MINSNKNGKTKERYGEGIKLKHHVNGLYTKDSSTFSTSIIVTDLDSKGRVMRIWTGNRNKTVLCGRAMLQELVFGVQPNPEQHLTLNTLLGIPHTTDVYENEDTKLYRQRFVEYFCIGNGAENKTNPGTSHSARDSDTNLFGIVPFRCVPEATDLTDVEAKQYRLRKKIEIKGKNYWAYYAKKMTIDKMYMMWNGSTYVPVQEHTVAKVDSDSSHPLSGASTKVFTVFNLEVAANEFKEYYRAMTGSLELAKLSELGLIAGYDTPLVKGEEDPDNNRLELATAELFAKMTHSPMPMDRDGNSRQIKYSIFS